MSQDASLVIGGPAIVIFNSATFYTESDVTVKVTKEYKRRNVGGFGAVPPKILDVKAEITFKPVQWSSLSTLFPYLGTAIGTRIFGNTDKSVVVQSMTEAVRYTWTRGAVTSAPKIGLGPRKELLGDCTITCVKANAAELSGATSVTALNSASAFADTSFDITKLFDIKYTIAWGASPFAAMESEDGVDAEINYEFAPTMIDGAMVDMWLKDVSAKASFKPVNLTHANLLTLANLQGIARGTALSPTGANDLVIAGGTTGDPKVTLTKAYVTDVGQKLAAGQHFADTFTLEAARTFTTGAANAIAAITVV